MKFTSSLSSTACSFSAVLPQLIWILWESDQLNIESNWASAPTGWGAILRAWLERCSSARNAASWCYCLLSSKENCAFHALCCRWRILAPCVYEQMHATVLPATNASWHVKHLKLPLLLTVREEECFKSAHGSTKWLFNLPPSFNSIQCRWTDSLLYVAVQEFLLLVKSQFRQVCRDKSTWHFFVL